MDWVGDTSEVTSLGSMRARDGLILARGDARCVGSRDLITVHNFLFHILSVFVSKAALALLF